MTLLKLLKPLTLPITLVLSVPLAPVLAGAWLAADQPEPVLALKGFDPIELAEGREVAGAEGRTLVHGLFRYRFASDANRDRFAAEPDERGIQFDGACAKMGPPGSVCDSGRWLVHERRIYLFASDICRAAFAKNPDNFGLDPDPEPAGDAAAHARGRELLAQVVKGFGGEAVLAGLRGLRIEQKLEVKQGEQTTRGLRVVTMAFPARFRRDEGWSDGEPWVYVVNADGAAQHGNGKEWRNGPQVADLQRRSALRHPLFLIQSRGEIGFVAIAAGRAKVGATDVELLDVAHDGATSRLAIDPATGRILEQTTSGRTSAGNTVVLHRFADFRDAGGGLILPCKDELVIAGNVATGYESGSPKFEVNPFLPPDHFALPD